MAAEQQQDDGSSQERRHGDSIRVAIVGRQRQGDGGWAAAVATVSGEVGDCSTTIGGQRQWDWRLFGGSWRSATATRRYQSDF